MDKYLHTSIANQTLSATVPTGTLKTVSLHGLSANESAQIATLVDACTTNGCFYLDLKAEGTQYTLLETATELLEPIKDFFDLPLETKLQWEMDKWGDMQIGGYKPPGKHSGVVEGKRDGFENFLVPLDALTRRDRHLHGEWPLTLESQLSKFTGFELSCQEILLCLLFKLSDALDNTISDRFEHSHRKIKTSTTSLACLKHLPGPALSDSQIGHMAHTDVGSLTMLFTSSPGLQVFDRNTSRWLLADPLPGLIVVNVGDALSFMSGGILKSCLHRVVPRREADGTTSARFALAFFQRPELLAKFTDGEGRQWTGEEWHRTKYKIFRAEVDEQRQNSLLTGVTGFLGSSGELRA